MLVLVLSASFVALGFWQLARNHHKQSLVRAARAAYAAPAPDITRAPVVAPGGRVQLSGRYDPAHSVLLRNRVHGGKDGNAKITLFSNQVGERVRALPGVRNAAAAWGTPFSGGGSDGYRIEGHES